MRSAELVFFGPARFIERTLEDFRPASESARRALAVARRFASGEISSCVLAGPTGVGKTHLARAMAAARYEAVLAAWQAMPLVTTETRYDDAGVAHESPLPPGYIPKRATPRPEGPMWVSVPELVVGLRLDMDRDRGDRAWADVGEEARRTQGILVLDDLGREKVSDWTGELVYSLVNGRYEGLRSTIVTTNLTGAELAASPYWPAISRLAEDGELVRIDAEDHRLLRAKAGRAAS